MCKLTWRKEPLLYTSFPLMFLWETRRLRCSNDQLTTFSALSPGSLHRFGTMFCFLGETNSGSEILFCKQEPKYNVIYDFPLWVKCFHCLHLIWAGVTRQRFPSNLFLSNVSFCLGVGREEAGCGQEPTAQPRLPSLLFMPKWQQQPSEKLKVKIILPSPSLLPSRNRETRSAENFPLWSRKEKTTTTKTSKLHADFEKVLSSSPGLAVWLNHVFVTPRRLIHHSYFRRLWFKYSL